MDDIFYRASSNDVLYFFNNQINLAIQDPRGQTLLHYAVRTSAKDVIGYLLDNDMDVNITDHNGETPLFDCAKKGKLMIA